MSYVKEDSIDFLDQEDFRARKIVVVANEVKPMKGGAAHEKFRGIAKGDAYCYEDVKFNAI